MDISNTVALGVGYGISYRIPAQLHTDDFLRLFAGDEADGPGPAIGINDPLFSGKMCKSNGLYLQKLRLLRIDLIERAR